MAEFCRQCAEDLDLPTEDFNIGEDDAIQTVLCEGCGPTNVTGDGTCIYDCERHHAEVNRLLAEHKAG